MSVCRSSSPPVTPSPPLPRRGMGGVGGRPGSARRVCVCAGQSHGNQLAAPPRSRAARAAAARAPPRRELRRLTLARRARPSGPAAWRGSPAGRVRRAGAAQAAHPRPKPAAGLGTRGRRRPGQCRPAAGWGAGEVGAREGARAALTPVLSSLPSLSVPPPPTFAAAAIASCTGPSSEKWRGGPGHGDPRAPRGQQTPHRVSSAGTRAGPAANLSTGGSGSARRQRPCRPAGRSAFPPSRSSRFPPERRARSGAQVSEPARSEHGRERRGHGGEQGAAGR